VPFNVCGWRLFDVKALLKAHLGGGEQADYKFVMWAAGV